MKKNSTITKIAIIGTLVIRIFLAIEAFFRVNILSPTIQNSICHYKSTIKIMQVINNPIDLL